MRYFLIVGEASGDLHASNLMRALIMQDPKAEFRFFGGDKMQAAVGNRGVMLSHYKDIAYMGFLSVLLHLRIILRAMRSCREAILDWQPDVLILVDYPGFNLKIAKYVKSHSRIPIYYYISPKIWAWKEHRIHAIKRDIDEMFSILPFEVDFYRRHNYAIHYVGNPSVDEITEWRACYGESREAFLQKHKLAVRPIIALLPGSRTSEIKSNFSRMLNVASSYVDKGYQLVVAGAPDIDDSFYQEILTKTQLSISGQYLNVLRNSTFELLSHSEVALVTSGTATLETALLKVPQVVCFYMRVGWFVSLLRKMFLKVKYISLVNLIVDRELVPELVASDMNETNLSARLSEIVRGGSGRDLQMEGYDEMALLLGEAGAPQRAAQIMVEKLRK